MMSANNKIQKSSFSEAQAKDNNDQDNLVVREDKKLNHHKHKSDQLLKEMLEYVQPETNIVDFHEDSQIAKFYEGRSVFITGASGFVGKVSIIVIDEHTRVGSLFVIAFVVKLTLTLIN